MYLLHLRYVKVFILFLILNFFTEMHLLKPFKLTAHTKWRLVTGVIIGLPCSEGDACQVSNWQVQK